MPGANQVWITLSRVAKYPIRPLNTPVMVFHVLENFRMDTNSGRFLSLYAKKRGLVFSVYVPIIFEQFALLGLKPFLLIEWLPTTDDGSRRR